MLRILAQILKWIIFEVQLINKYVWVGQKKKKQHRNNSDYFFLLIILQIRMVLKLELKYRVSAKYIKQLLCI